MALECGAGSTEYGRNATEQALDDPLGVANQYAGDTWTLEHSTVGPAGPWTPANLVELGDQQTDCVGDNSGAAFSQGGAAAGLAVLAYDVGLTPDTDYWYRWTHVSGNTEVGSQFVCGPTRTAAIPTDTLCLGNGDPTDTTLEAQFAVSAPANGGFNILQDCNTDTVIWEIATVPGGPYTAEPSEDVTGFSPSHTFTGLTAGANYFVRARVSDAQGNEFLVTDECPYTTTGGGGAPVCGPTNPESDPEDVPIGPLVIPATGDITSYASAGLPPGIVVDPDTGVLSGTPTTPGVYNVTNTVTGPGGECESTFVWTITAAVDPGDGPTPVVLDPCQIAPSVTVEPAECEEPLYGLKSVADVKPITDPHLENGAEWSPYDCEMAEGYCNKCTFPGDPKVYHEQGDLKKALPFGVYGSFKCSGPGWSLDKMQERARKNLELGQWRRIEREFIATLQNDNPVEPDTIDLTPATGAVPLAVGVAALEDWAGEFISCRPTLHLPRGVATLMAKENLLATGLDDVRMRTFIGSLVAAGGGYNNLGPDGTAAEDGTAWIYVTGTVRIWLGNVLDVTGAPDAKSIVDTQNNDLRALAERPVVAGHECGAAAININLC